MRVAPLIHPAQRNVLKQLLEDSFAQKAKILPTGVGRLFKSFLKRRCVTSPNPAVCDSLGSQDLNYPHTAVSGIFAFFARHLEYGLV